MKVAAAILAGGRARRLGGAFKGGLEVGGRTILARELAALARVTDEILLVADEAARKSEMGFAFSRESEAGFTFARESEIGFTFVADRAPGLGPLAGIDAAFAATRADALLVVGCDLPFLDERLLALVRDAAPGAEAVMPRVAGRPQALHARYARSIVPAVADRLRRGELRLLDLVAGVRAWFLDEPELRAIDPSLRGLTNVNTPDELEAARALAR
ncbi:MAG TPA: molybdenum cofactor guanylyltransferase [Polyangia bacterium]|nr:molybdenum cofactor guanylyltransferase [Polyangia bacterium]